MFTTSTMFHLSHVLICFSYGWADIDKPKPPVNRSNIMHAVFMVISATSIENWPPGIKQQWCKAYHSMLKEGSSTRMKILSTSDIEQDISPSLS